MKNLPSDPKTGRGCPSLVGGRPAKSVAGNGRVGSNPTPRANSACHLKSALPCSHYHACPPSSASDLNGLTVSNNAGLQLYMQNVYAFENSFLRTYEQASALMRWSSIVKSCDPCSNPLRISLHVFRLKPTQSRKGLRQSLRAVLAP